MMVAPPRNGTARIIAHPHMRKSGPTPVERRTPAEDEREQATSAVKAILARNRAKLGPSFALPPVGSGRHLYYQVRGQAARGMRFEQSWLDWNGITWDELLLLAWEDARLSPPYEDEVQEEEESQESDSRNARNAKNPPQGDAPFSAFSEYVSKPSPPEPEPGKQPGEMPTPDAAMFHGVAGDIVDAITPESEASPVALLVQLLICAGNVIGRTRYIQIEATRHYPNEFALLVGKTSVARKGTSWGHVAHVFEKATHDWLVTHLVTGLSSGEGIIHALRDIRAGEDVDPDDVLRRDKRLLALEGEFASVLHQATRQGNILSLILRHGWDGTPIGNLTKNSPERATDHLISVVDHITQAELIACMTTTDVMNGYANRFLFVATDRSHLLPFGGGPRRH
jgi:hypothetical protein